MSVVDERVETPAAVDSTDVSVGIGQARHLEGTNRFQASLRFDSEEPVFVDQILLRSNLFAVLEPEAKDSMLTPSRAVDIQFDLGPPHCDADPDDATASVDVVARVGERGAPRALTLRAPTGYLTREHARACARKDLAERVDIRFGAFGPVDGAALDVDLVLERVDTDERITLERVSGSVILSVDAPSVAGDGSEPVAVLEPGDEVVDIPLTVTATRCDPHGLSGSQKTFVFSVIAAVGDGDAVFLEVRPDDELEDAMREAIDGCVTAHG